MQSQLLVRTCPSRFRNVNQLGLERACHASGMSIRTLAHACAYIVRMDISVVNPRCACAARVIVVVMSVCLSVTSLERLFVLKTLSRTQRATKVKIFVGFSLKMLRCKARAVPALYG